MHYTFLDMVFNYILMLLLFFFILRHKENCEIEMSVGFFYAREMMLLFYSKFSGMDVAKSFSAIRNEVVEPIVKRGSLCAVF